MSYRAITRANEELGSGDSDMNVLYEAIRHVGNWGQDVIVTNDRGEEIWFVEADIKVSESDPFYPAIVHDRQQVAAMQGG